MQKLREKSAWCLGIINLLLKKLLFAIVLQIKSDQPAEQTYFKTNDSHFQLMSKICQNFIVRRLLKKHLIVPEENLVLSACVHFFSSCIACIALTSHMSFFNGREAC